MLFTTPTQFVVLGLLLIVGWLFGLASHPGGKRWRNAYDEEAVGRAQDRDELDGQLRQADARVAELEARNAELEREIERVRAEQPSRVAPALAGAAVGAVAASAARPAFERDAPAPTPAPAPEPELQAAPASEPAPEPEPAKRGWFDWGKTDDLTRLRGIDGDLERRLKAEKIDSYRELAVLSDQDELGLERRLDLPAGFIQREQLREQAQLLANGDTDGHAQRFG